MATVTVMDKNSPTKPGPGHLSAQTALNAINNRNKNWKVTMDWKEHATRYSSSKASKIELLKEVKAEFNENFYDIN
ncbi:MAG TPA: hypothetical protein VFQ86_02745 [Arachidicoccus soli]|nr:hypothetical protein [Arachidicoccus soli]